MAVSRKKLHAPIGVSKEDALAYARSKGIDAVGLRDILLANGDTLHAPENLTDEEAIKQVSALHPDMDFTLPKKNDLTDKRARLSYYAFK